MIINDYLLGYIIGLVSGLIVGFVAGVRHVYNKMVKKK